MKTEKNQSTLFTNPSKKQVIAVTTLWVIGFLLVVLSVTNLFQESLFQLKNVFMYFWVILSFFSVLKIHSSYWGK